MSRFLMLDGTTGGILTVITESDPAIAALYAVQPDAPVGAVVMAITTDTGAHIQEDVVKVDLETGGIVTSADGEPVSDFEGSVLEQIDITE